MAPKTHFPTLGILAWLWQLVSLLYYIFDLGRESVELFAQFHLAKFLVVNAELSSHHMGSASHIVHDK